MLCPCPRALPLRWMPPPKNSSPNTERITCPKLPKCTSAPPCAHRACPNPRRSSGNLDERQKKRNSVGTLVTHSYVAYATYLFSGLGKAPGPTKSSKLLECGCHLPLWFLRSVSKYRDSNLDKAAEGSRTPRRWREVPSHRCVPPHAKHVLCYIIRAATRK